VGAHEGDVGDAEEAQHRVDGDLMQVQRVGVLAHAAARRHHDHALAGGQAFRAVGGVAEGAAGLRDAVDPGLELARDAEVVLRRANHQHVGGHEFGQELLGALQFGLLHGVQAVLRAAQHGQMVARWAGLPSRSRTVTLAPGFLATRSATMLAVRLRDTELSPSTLESICRMFMSGSTWFGWDG
jgi:hypothetical protein